ncbi:MAG: metallophosphoesterase [Candidatus Aenigmarchaeota archaeon]|nr:metallophosphoesterase [Candidatus Aenigmarchaeota archaeon]
MIIAATSDIHLPNNYQEFVMAVDRMRKKPDLFLVAGDVVDRGEANEYDKFYNIIFGKFSCPIFSCFGNGEFHQMQEDLRKNYRDIKFLDDSSAAVMVGSKTVGIFGTTGSLDSPTPWQSANIPNIEGVYRGRVLETDSALSTMEADFKILLMHYAPTYKTLEGENPRYFQNMGSSAYESVILSRRPSLVIHGHSHRGTKQAWLETVPVFNVSFPLNREIVIIDTDQLKPGLSRFV